MASCLYCNRWIIFGGERHNGRRYCSTTCLDEHFGGYLEDHLDPELVEQALAETVAQGCTGCGHKRVDARWISRYVDSADSDGPIESKRLYRSCWRCAVAELRKVAWTNFWTAPYGRYRKLIKARVDRRNWVSLLTRNRRQASPLLREWVVRDLCARHQIVVERPEQTGHGWDRVMLGIVDLADAL